MIKIAICDNNIELCDELEKNFLKYFDEKAIKIEVFIFKTGEKIIDFIKNVHSFDIIFLDIELGGKNGIEIGQIIRRNLDDHIVKIVFITSKNGYELDMFDIQPFNLLKKPIDEKKIINTLELLVKLLEIDSKVFEYKIRQEFKRVPFKNIIYLESSLRKIKVVSTEFEDLFYGSLSKQKEKLPKNFIFVHNSYIVNYNFIEKIYEGNVLMSNKDIIPVSKRNTKNIRNLQIQIIKERKNIDI